MKGKSQLHRSLMTVSGLTFVSRVFGFVRDVVFASLFGASVGYDAFILAFKIPNFLRRLFAEGAFSQAFVPVLSEYQACEPQESVQALIDRVAGCLGLVLMGVTLVGVLAAPVFIYLFAPGFDVSDSRFVLATSMLRITFGYILLISLTAFAGGVLNIHKRFAGPAVTPVLLNLTLIFSAIVIAPYQAEPVTALAWGVLLGGLLQLWFQLPCLRRIPCHIKPKLDWQHPGVRRIMTLMVPALLGASVMQVNLMVDTIFASFLPVGSLSWLYYSDRLLEFPLGIFGVALATVVLPHLSEQHAKGDSQHFQASMDWAFRWIVLIGLPATMGLILLAGPILTTLFQYGEFTIQDVWMARKSLIALSVGLMAFISVKIFVSAFYAKQNTKFPVKVAIFAMGINVLLNALLIGPLQHAGLALASTLASAFNVSVLFVALWRQKAYRPLSGWPLFLCRMVLANVCMMGVILVWSPALTYWTAWPTFLRVLTLVKIMGVAGGVYALVLFLSGLRIGHLRLQRVL